MDWYGLSGGSLAAIAGAAGAITVGLYVLKVRRRPVAVPFARLWTQVLRDEQTTSLFSRLQRVLSLLVQLVLLSLLVLALGDPRGVSRAPARSVVVLVDASASMKAVDLATPLDPHRARIDEARARVRALTRELGEKDRMLVAQMDAEVTPLSTLTHEATELERAAAELRASDTQADLAKALAYAADVLRGLPAPEIVVVSDGNLDPEAGARAGQPVAPAGVALRFVPVGKRGRNVAVTNLSVRRYPFDRDQYEVLLELYNASASPEHVELTLLGDGRVVEVTRLELGAGERSTRRYANLSGARRTLEAEVKLADGKADDLPADDRGYATLPEARRIRALCVTKGNTYLEAALLAAPYVDAVFAPPERVPEPRAGSFDVVLFDSVAPSRQAFAPSALYVNPPPETGPVRVNARELRDVGFDVLDAKNPLLRYTALDDAFVARAHALGPSPGDRVVAASTQGPLIVAGRRGEERFIALGFDPRQSDMVVRAAWPLFMLNALDELASEDAAFFSDYRTGRAWRIPVGRSAIEAWVTSPSGSRRRAPIEGGRAVFFGTEAGLFDVDVLAADGARSKVSFAANLASPLESSIEPKLELRVGGVPATPVVEAGARRFPSEAWVWLVVLAALIATVEWFTYHRRITV